MSDCNVCGGRHNPSKGVFCDSCGKEKFEDFYNELPVLEPTPKSPISPNFVSTMSKEDRSDYEELNETVSITGESRNIW